MKKFKISALMESSYFEEVEFIIEAESQEEAKAKFRAESNKFEFKNETKTSWHGDDHKLVVDGEGSDLEISEITYVNTSLWRYMLLGDTANRITQKKYTAFEDALIDLGITAQCVESFSVIKGTEELIAENVA